MTKLFFSILLLMLVFASSFIYYEKDSKSYGLDTLDLLNKNINWSTHNYAVLNQSEGEYNMTTNTQKNDTIYNRIYSVINVSDSNSPPILKLTYATNSTHGNPQFVFEVRSNKTNSDSSNQSPFVQFFAPDKVNTSTIYSIDLGNTLGYKTIRSYQLPSEISNSSSEIRFYIISDGPARADLILNNASILLNKDDT